MAIPWSYSTEAEEIGKRLIERDFFFLDGIEVRYLFTDKPMKREGRRVAASSHKATGIDLFWAKVTAEFYYIIIDREIWEQALSDDQHEALVHHELGHFRGKNKTGGLTLVGHDIEEFNATYSRYGAWHAGIEKFLNRQPALPFDEAEQGTGGFQGLVESITDAGDEEGNENGGAEENGKRRRTRAAAAG